MFQQAEDILNVVVVNYNKSRCIVNLVYSLLCQDFPPANVIIVDNSGELRVDSFRDPLPFQLHLLRPGSNMGYSVGVNIGVSLAISLCGESYILLLSPDIELQSPSVTADLLRSYHQLGGRLFLGCSQRNPDGTYENVARTFPSIVSQLSRKISILPPFLSGSLRSYLSTYASEYDPYSVPQSVDWLQSSLLLFHACCWREIVCLDPRYFLFMADVELGHQAFAAGIPIYLDRRSFVLADGVRASGGGFLSLVLTRPGRLHLRDAFRYYLKQILHK